MTGTHRSRDGRRPNVFYYPTYEMITGASADPCEDNRYPRQGVIYGVMACFEPAIILPDYASKDQPIDPLDYSLIDQLDSIRHCLVTTTMAEKNP